MKIKHLFLLLASAAFVALSCEKNNENKPEEKDTTPVPEISVITTAFPSIADAGGTLEVTISSNVDWTVSIPEAANWLSANPASGAAGEEITITFTAAANDTYDKRTATVTVSGENKKGSDSEEFTVSQKQKDALILSDDEIEVGYEGETINIVLQANSDFTYAIAEDAQSWIIPVQANAAPTRALVESTVAFNVLPNTVKEAREGVITFTNAAGDETVTVKQEALPEPDPELAITPASIADVEVAGAEVKLALTSNMPWVVSIPEGVDWLTVSPTQGEAGENVEVTVTIQENDANDGRTTDLTFTCTNAENESKDVVIKVSQKGLNIPSSVSISSAEELIQFATRYSSGYYDVVADILTVTLDANITFDATSSEAFNATGGIGARVDNKAHPFKGTFNGGNHSIGGLVATVPVFPFTDQGSSISNLNILNTCSFSFTRDMSKRAIYMGALAGSTGANIENVSVAADVSLVASLDNDCETAVGGLVGSLNAGTIKDCSYSGKISTTSDFKTTERVLLGGIAGMLNSGTVNNSHFDGTMSNEAIIVQNDSIYKTTPLLAMGGIAGYNFRGGNIISCVTNDAETKIDGSYADSKGTLVNKTVQTWNCAVGGIVGENEEGTVQGSTNKAYILNTVFKTENQDSCARYMRVGGIVGINGENGSVTGSNNEGQLMNRSNPRLQSVGGIAGRNYGTITGCTNKAALGIGTAGTGSYSARLAYFGGVIGENLGGTVSDVHNIAELLLSRTENTTGTDVRMGGVIGSNHSAIDGGAGRNITNTGKVYYNINISNQAIKYCIGGIAGYTEASIKGVENKGYVLFNWNSDANVAKLAHVGGVVGYMNGNGTLENCVNTGGADNGGEVYVAVKKGSAKHTQNYAGGILGYSVKNVEIKNCSNSGYVHGGNATKQNGTNLYVGGIVAYLGGASSIADCSNTGVLLNDHFSNTVTTAGATFEGGIAGFVLGTAEHRIAISNVSNALSDGVTTTTGGRRGYNGGIVGYAEYADITGATNAVNYDAGSGYFIGGLAGWLVNSTLSSGTYSGTSIKSSQLQGAGGIVAVLGEGSVVDGCSSSVAAFAHTDTNKDGKIVAGAIAGSSVAGSTIKKCHYKATGTVENKSSNASPASWAMDICSDSNFTAGTGDEANVADVE